MGKASEYLSNLGNGLLSGIGEGLTGGIGGLVSSGIQGLASLFGPSQKKLIKWQKEAQMELNEQAAATNYEYGEKSAENAYKRQMEMYERSYQDQSYAAQRKQMEDAGLSVGLMYGGGGAGGGAAGSMQGAPQGATGGAQAGDAGTALSLAMEQKRLQNETMIAAADASLKRAEAKKANADANLNQAQATTENTIRQFKVEMLKQEGMKTWIDNVRRKWEDIQELYNENGEPEDYVTEHELYGKYAILGKSLRNSTAIKMAIRTTLENQGIAASNQKIENEIQKITQDILTGKAEEAVKKALAIKTSAETKDIQLKNGEESNWMTWLNVAFQSIAALCSIGNTVGQLVGLKKVGRFIQSVARTPKSAKTEEGSAFEEALSKWMNEVSYEQPVDQGF